MYLATIAFEPWKKLMGSHRRKPQTRTLHRNCKNIETSEEEVTFDEGNRSALSSVPCSPGNIKAVSFQPCGVFLLACV